MSVACNQPNLDGCRLDGSNGPGMTFSQGRHNDTSVLERISSCGTQLRHGLSLEPKSILLMGRKMEQEGCSGHGGSWGQVKDYGDGGWDFYLILFSKQPAGTHHHGQLTVTSHMGYIQGLQYFLGHLGACLYFLS